MPLTAAVGSISLAVDYLRAMIADCATFRTWTSTASHATALAKVYYESIPPPADGNEHTLAELTALRPYAIVYTSPDTGMTLRRDSTGPIPDDRGGLMVHFKQTVEATIVNDAAEISRRFANVIGAILDEMMEFAAVSQDGYLDIRELEFAYGPYREDPDTESAQGVTIAAEVRVAWGFE